MFSVSTLVLQVRPGFGPGRWRCPRSGRRGVPGHRRDQRVLDLVLTDGAL